ncbi:MAG: glycosyltransferase [Elusimicrobiota bacterium]
MSAKTLEVSAVVPVYCEEGGIGQVLDGLKAVLERCCARYEIVVVDDGSPTGPWRSPGPGGSARWRIR